MKQKYFFLFILIFVIFTHPTFACPPSISEHLYIKDFYAFSDDFHFLTTNLDQVNYSNDDKESINYMYFNFSGNPKYLKILVDDNELVTSNISSLKSEIIRYYSESPQATTNDIKVTIQVYEYPSKEIYKRLIELNNNLSHYDNKHIKIFLDDKLVREYSMGYKPAIIYKCDTYQPYSPFSLDAKIIAVLILLLIGVILSIFKMRK